MNKKTFKKIIIALSFVFLLLSPLYIDKTTVYVAVVDAKCRSYCKAFKKATSIWAGFFGKVSGVASQAVTIVSGLQPFGGKIIATLPCTGNGVTAFVMLPSAGVPGPYIVSPAGLRSYGAVVPGNNVIGMSYPGGVCVIIVAGYPIPFPVAQTVTVFPGMGTSLTP